MLVGIDDVIDVITQEENVQEAYRTCHACSCNLSATDIECPACGVINFTGKRVRQPKNRPSRETVETVTSANHNGTYTVFRNSDGTLSCNCLSFLLQRGVEGSSCKHIRAINYSLPTDNLPLLKMPLKPSDWQIAALKKLGIENHEHLTNAQAYFVIQDLLEKQGMDYREYENTLKIHGRVSLLPIYSFGVELEGLVRSRESFLNNLVTAGIPAVNTGRDHALTTKWKIGTDGSVTGISGYETMELVSPKLFGASGFNVLKKAMEVWNETGASINKSCGFHVHIDAWNWDSQDLLNLALVWAKIEQTVIWYLVSPSRRRNNYCLPLSTGYLLNLAEGRYPARYHSLNVSAFTRYKTVEFRIHGGTAEYQKAAPWVVFCLKLVDAVKKGLRHNQVEPSFEGVMEAIGMSGAGVTPFIKEAKEFLYSRYQHWKRDAEANPFHVPDIPAASVDIEGEIRRRNIDSARANLLFQFRTRQRMEEYNENLPPNAVVNLSHRIPSGVVWEERFREISPNRWEVPSRNREGAYEVVLDTNSDTLTCQCRGFRSNGYCYHSINLARFLTYRRRMQEIGGEIEE